MAQNKPDLRKVAQNKKAYHDYFVTETFEAGLELFGTEVKSIRNGKVNLKDSWCHVKNGEIFANGMHISPYEKGNIFNRDPMRPKRLLMHKREIKRLFVVVQLMGDKKIENSTQIWYDVSIHKNTYEKELNFP